MMLDAFERMRQICASIEPPKFDRVVVQDMCVLDSIPRRDASEFGMFCTLSGIPVLLDADVEPGVIELRHGDELCGRFRI